jgi:hypothetical protein
MPEATVDTQLVTTQPRHAGLIGWLSFVAWAAVGSGIVFGFFLFSIFVLAAAVLIGVLVSFQPSLRRGAYGLLSGAGAISLWVAWVQRKGPGTVYWHTASASGSNQYLDPRPWLAAGIVLVSAGVGAHLWRNRSRRQADPSITTDEGDS